MVALEAYPHIYHHCTQREALEVIGNAHIEMHGESSLPRILLVFEDDDALVGMIRRRDIMAGLSPRWFFKAEADHPEAVFDVDPDHTISDVLSDKVVERFRDRSEETIEEYVHPIEHSVEADDTLVRIVRVMVEKEQHMLPVLDNERVIGVVRSVEVLWAVRELLNNGGGAFND